MSSVVFGNATDRIHWKPSNESRGTFDVLSTCILTMILCVWTAVHLNVPAPGDPFGLYLRKVGWLILGLLAPEMVAYTAWYQRQEAAKVTMMVNRYRDVDEPRSWIKRTTGEIKNDCASLVRGIQRKPTSEVREDLAQAEPWSLAHGFFASMGGFGIQINKFHESQHFAEFETKEICFLNARGLRLVDERDQFKRWLPPISENAIGSKSRASAVAKALVCLQALWFITQCITRLIQHIPISLLELNTFGHAVCAILIYILWWNKPFDVDYPNVFESPMLEKRRALELMKTPSSGATEAIKQIKARIRGDKRYPEFRKRVEREVFKYMHVELDLIIPCDKAAREDGFPPRDDAALRELPLRQVERFRISRIDDTSPSTKPPDPVTLHSGQRLDGTGWRVKVPAELFAHVKDPVSFQWVQECLQESNWNAGNDEVRLERGDCLLQGTLPMISLASLDVSRWRSAWTAPLFEKERSRACDRHGCDTYDTTLVRRCTDWPRKSSIEHPSLLLGFSLAGFIYGGLHALAWSATFDHNSQRLLWRISACAVMSGLPAILVPMVLADRGKKRFSDSKYLIVNAARLVWVPVLLLYLLARAYLVVECFINLFNLPAGVYKVPRWTVYVPHIS